MIRFRFGHEDLVRTRFAISPLFDLTWSTDVLRDPAAHSLHLPWARAARRRLEGFDFELLDLLAIASPHGYAPDFVAPPPTTPLAELDDELARVRATPHERVAREVGWRFEGAAVPDAARALLDDPERGLAELTTMMAEYFERAIAPWWPEIRAALEDDILHRARRLTAGGAIEVFEDLHHQVRWRDGVLEIDRPYEQQVELGGRGLLLVPAAFAWPRVFAMFDEPWQPALIYTPRGLGSLWAPARRRRRRRGARGPARPPPRGDPRDARHPGGHERPGAAPRRLGGRRQRAPRRPATGRAGARGARRAARPLLAHAQRRRAPAPRLRRPQRPAGSSTTAQSPSTSSSPGDTRARPTRRPMSHVPLLDPRSTASHAPSSARSSRCRRETVAGA